MSIPVKIQCEDMGEEWRNIFILSDGSLYGVQHGNNKVTVVPLSRSYTGQVIKERMKYTMTTHHYYVRQAALARRSRDFVTADRYSSIAKDVLVRYKNMERMWDVFRSFSPKIIRKKERAERFKEQNKVGRKSKKSSNKNYWKECCFSEIDGIPLPRGKKKR